MKKALFLLVVTILLFTKVQASHFSGGEVRYEFNGTNYTVYVTLYKVCDWASASLPTAASVNFKSALTSKNFNRTLPLINFDTVNISCGGATSTCLSSSGTIPGYIAAYFKDTVSLTAAADWVISYTDAARINTLLNLSTGSAVMYLQTTLNNTASVNSNPLIASVPTYYMTVSNAISVPLQAIDPEGDSLVFQLITPYDAATTPSTYAAGYSLTNPFGTGGTCAINTTTNTLNMMSATSGKFVIAYRVYEYRNSLFIGAYHRELMVVVLPGTSALTFPRPNTGSVFSVYTCPGQSNSVTIGFNDPTATDSVYLTVMPPVMAGWTFSSTTSNALGGASTTITWTTPSGMNPATLPHFFIKIRARDNGCPNASTEYALTVRTRQCLADSVWPGDANGDFTVNIYDPLAIAIASGQTGAARTSPTTAWIAQSCAPWTNVFTTNNTNMKHADCDGNGTVNSSDLAAVSSNYGAFHLKGGSLPKTTAGVPDLYFDVTGIAFIAGTTVSVPLKLGSTTTPMNNLYGVAARISVSGVTLATPPTASTTTSWMGSSSSLINFAKPVSNSTLDMVVAKQDQSMVSGQGTIATVSISIPAGTPSGTTIQLNIDNTITRLIDNKGLAITAYNLPTTPASGVVIAAAVNQINSNITNAFIVPNPASTNAELNLSVKTNCEVMIDIVDITGKRVWQNKLQLNAGKTYMPLPVKELHSGMYSVRVSTAENNEPTVLKWIVQ